jgi:hypothetical protein
MAANVQQRTHHAVNESIVAYFTRVLADPACDPFITYWFNRDARKILNYMDDENYRNRSFTIMDTMMKALEEDPSTLTPKQVLQILLSMNIEKLYNLGERPPATEDQDDTDDEGDWNGPIDEDQMQEIYRRNPHKYFLHEIWDDEEDALNDDTERNHVIDILHYIVDPQPPAKKKGGRKSKKNRKSRKRKSKKY